MTYQNINQYNFRKWGLVPVREITDICLANDERDYDQEVVFSPFLIGEFDGNRMPFKFDFNSSATTLSQSGSTFENDTIVSENYWNPTNTDPDFCPKITLLCDIGLTGIDNGLVKKMSGETIELTTGLYTSLPEKFSRYKYDRRMKLHPITGFTTSQNRLVTDNSYNYNISYSRDANDIGYFVRFNGGFYQGFYKVHGYDYQIFPERVNLGWTTEIILRYRWTGDTNVGLNNRYPNNKGTFFYMGARAENKFYHYADGSPMSDTGYTRVTKGLTCMKTCGCSSSANTASTCSSVYQISGGTTTNCSCGCPCSCQTYVDYPEKNPLYDGVSNGLSLRLSGDNGNPRLCVKTFRITGGCETSGTCLTGLTYMTGVSVTEWCSSKGIFDICKDTVYVNSEHWVQIDTVFQRYTYLDECDLLDKGGLGLIVKTEFTATSANNSISLVIPPTTHQEVYDPATTEVVKFNDGWTEEQKYRLGSLKFFVNGRLFFVIENFEEIIPRLLNVEKEKQIGVGYNISIGGGTQGLHDNLTFSGCSQDINELDYQQDPECLTTDDLDNTEYSGLTTNIMLEKIFGGSLIGDVSTFKMYIEPLNASQIRHNFLLLKDKYFLLNPSCPDCSMVVQITPTPILTLTSSQTPTPTSTPTETPTQTPTPTLTPTTIYYYYFLLDCDFTHNKIGRSIFGGLSGVYNVSTSQCYQIVGQDLGPVYNYDLDSSTFVTDCSDSLCLPPTPTQTPTQSETPTQTPTPTNTETPTQTPTQSESPTPTNTETPTQTPTPTYTETPTQTPTPTATEPETNFLLQENFSLILQEDSSKILLSGNSIISNGLTLKLDTNNPSSYPGSGSVWYDIAGTQQNVTLVNSPIFTSGIPSYFTFNGSYGTGSGDVLPTTGYSKSVWFYLNSYTDNNLVSKEGQHYMFFAGTNKLYSGHANWAGFPTNYPSTASFSLNTWYNVTLTFNTTDGMILYINGVFDSSYTTIKTAFVGDGSINVASYGVGNLLDGRISIVYCYDRSLTSSEVLQNFNSDKSLFGL